MSRLADPQYDDLYSLSSVVVTAGEDDTPLTGDLETLVTRFKVMQETTNKISCNVHKYDSKTGAKANGFRSLLRVTATLVRHSVDLLETMRHQQGTLGYVSAEVKQDLNTWMKVAERMNDLMMIAAEMMETSDRLYPEKPNCLEPKVAEMSQKVLHLDVTPFYGSALGFHLRGDSRRMMLPLAISMASYSDIYGGSIFGKIKRLRDSGMCWNYIKDSDVLAKKIVSNSRNMQVDFAQNFYNMSESDWVSRMKTLPKVATSISHKINFTQMEVERNNSDIKFKVPTPASHISKKSVTIRLVANFRSKKMLGSCGCTTKLTCTCQFPPEVDTVMLHVHGGGFISQTSKSHLDYLHQWANELEIPIVSVDYSLAPEAPYPRALEEVFYVYCWLLNNFPAVGTTGKKIIFAGDSAGGNLVTASLLKCLTNHIRSPDALLLEYAALLIQFYPSPSRLLSLIDPLLMFGILLRCLNAYQDPNYLKSLPRTISQELKNAKSVNDMFMSPLLAPSDILAKFPRTLIVASDLDPCLDENVMFSSRLSEAGVNVKMEVMPGMPHGFLAFGQMSSECQLGVNHVTKRIAELLKVLNE